MTTFLKTILTLTLAFFYMETNAQISHFNATSSCKTPSSKQLHNSLLLALNQETKNTPQSILYVSSNAIMTANSTNNLTIGNPNKDPHNQLNKENLRRDISANHFQTISSTESTIIEKEPFLINRRNVYSSLWAFASLNYLYADLVGFMDAQVHQEYHTGTVNGLEMTPGFLTIAGAFMQIPIANVFLPQVIKNDRTLRCIQIVSGSIMSLIQAGTLFAGPPTPYYLLFSAVEIAATTYITIDAIKWNPLAKKKRKRKNN